MMETGTFATIVFVIFGIVLHVLWLRNEHDKKHWVNGALLIFYGVFFGWYSANGAIVPLNIGVLLGFAWLDMFE